MGIKANCKSKLTHQADPGGQTGENGGRYDKGHTIDVPHQLGTEKAGHESGEEAGQDNRESDYLPAHAGSRKSR